MRSAWAVIGANWGDEGKGRAVDALACLSPRPPVVIRFNGGAQAGHTVQVGGKRHVFSHFGSGVMAGCDTYLAKHFVVNPTIFLREYKELVSAGIKPTITAIDYGCPITTPYDILLNHWIEEKRGDNRHGSCGIGFNETVERCLSYRRTTMLDALYDSLRDRLVQVAQEYVPFRMKALGLELTAERAQLLKSEQLREDWLGEVKALLGHVRLMDYRSFDRWQDQSVIFEGAQGLLLDQHRGLAFPHLTRSSTGLTNIAPLARRLDLDHLKVMYMTRPYLTRHGAGPLPGECADLDRLGITVDDPTNRRNDWQGSLRFAPAMPALTKLAIDSDLRHVNFGVMTRVEPHLGLTCLDQLSNQKDADAWYRMDGLPVALECRGPERSQTEYRREEAA